VEEGYVEFDKTVDVIAGADARREASNRVARFLMLTRSGKSLEERVYIDGTCKLKAMIMCPFVERGCAFSR